jgi:hypothetical protein
MTRKFNVFSLATESEQEPVDFNTGVQVDADELRSIDLQEELSTVQEMCDLNEETMEQAINLEQLASIAQESIDTGGLNSTGITLLSNSAQDIYSKIGLINKKAVSLEAFNQTNTKIQNTKLAIESINEGLKKAWDAIIKFMVNILDHVKMFFAKIFDANTRNKEKSKKLAIAIKSIEKNLPKQDKFESMSLALRMRVNPASTEVTTLEFIKGVEYTSKLTENLTDIATSLNMGAAPLAHLNSLDELKDTSIVEKIYGPIQILPLHPHPKIREMPGVSIMTSQYLPGGKVLVSTVPNKLKNKDYEKDKVSDIILTLVGLKIFVSPVADVVSGGGAVDLKSGSIDVLKPESMKQLLKDVNHITDQGVDQARKSLDNFNKNNQAMVSAIKKLSQKLTDPTPEDNERIKTINFLFPKLNSLVSGLITSSTKLAMEVVSTSLTLIEKSITMYDKHDAVKDEPAQQSNSSSSGMKMLTA